MDRVVIATVEGNTIQVLSSFPDARSAYQSLKGLPEGTYSVLTFNETNIGVAPPAPSRGMRVSRGRKFATRPGRKPKNGGAEAHSAA